MVGEFGHSIHPRTTSTAKEITPVFKAMANDPCPTALTSRSKFVDGTLEAIKSVDFITFHDLEIFVVCISTVIASFHVFLLCLRQN